MPLTSANRACSTSVPLLLRRLLHHPDTQGIQVDRSSKVRMNLRGPVRQSFTKNIMEILRAIACSFDVGSQKRTAFISSMPHFH
jgi:hypothetical protein